MENEQKSPAVAGQVERRVRQRATLAELNKREPKHTLILRLLAEAETPKTGLPSVVDALEFRRDQYGLTRSEFAAVLGLAPGHYSEFINGKRELPAVGGRRKGAVRLAEGQIRRFVADRADG